MSRKILWPGALNGRGARTAGIAGILASIGLALVLMFAAQPAGTVSAGPGDNWNDDHCGRAARQYICADQHGDYDDDDDSDNDDECSGPSALHNDDCDEDDDDEDPCVQSKDCGDDDEDPCDGNNPPQWCDDNDNDDENENDCDGHNDPKWCDDDDDCEGHDKPWWCDGNDDDCDWDNHTNHNSHDDWRCHTDDCDFEEALAAVDYTKYVVVGTNADTCVVTIGPKHVPTPQTIVVPAPNVVINNQAPAPIIIQQPQAVLAASAGAQQIAPPKTGDAGLLGGNSNSALPFAALAAVLGFVGLSVASFAYAKRER